MFSSIIIANFILENFIKGFVIQSVQTYHIVVR